ncbi:CTD phosphatase Fcp1 [Schizosaccharomyces cryophilus OY26]|uniref:RNA polymerase II subunit A C-terminal domain phosphatase n=1 Tax=Schizosaccharomyces cryophilus (strain OY26 / ATCC MYA-4695 / CBS 11777 / NBRC 106824 / NRRL Y48691) TaxID=653667 RepID=S9W3E1_SCHCR|nr:CTD phosphatase Fcp1 [Schizosaccharomyces cryophilus OY26]EPY52460.1 CTD phosphatase Fcp1 [Schizosaccharomyces cryophilus OY26]
MSERLTPIRLPNTLNYPIEIAKCLVPGGTYVKRHTPLLLYRFFTKVKEDQEDGTEEYVDREFIEQFECPVEGKLVEWEVENDEQLENNLKVVAKLHEPCTHEVHYGGLCAICGENITSQDYMGYSDMTRANISMTHDTGGLTVSLDEASRIEEQNVSRLRKERRLSLIVDLDQTIIHATVDPTVGEWMSDPSNVNYHLLKDVRSFYLQEGYRTYSSCYYIKLRPGLQEFLTRISSMYELHIYTMGTKAYAKEIAKIIDPEGKVFQDRVLSRDDSGSLTQKSLQRLFPCDTSMVVIIDDRGDIWDWNPNLIKVVPFEFFVGIGDINSNFLAKPTPLPEQENTSPVETPHEQTESVDVNTNQDAVLPESSASLPGSSTIPERTLLKETFLQDKQALDEQNKERFTALQLQKSERPLAKQQNALLEEDEPDHSVLHGGDKELLHLERVLTRIHQAYYDEESNNEKEANKVHANVERIIPSMKSKVLKGCRILFSGVIPLGIDVVTSDIARWATSFGAQIVVDFDQSPTHLIAAKIRTEKVKTAITLGNVRVVKLNWLTESLSMWERLPESNYLLYPSYDLPDRALSDHYYSSDSNDEQRTYEINDRELDDIDWNEADRDVEDALGDLSEGDDNEENPRESDEATPADNESGSKKRKTDKDDSLSKAYDEKRKKPNEARSTKESSNQGQQGSNENDLEGLQDLAELMEEELSRKEMS